jgi:O-antigen ligase
MWRRHPWTGVGSDNFRRLHAAYGGWISLDVPASAHNAWLETAATTGLLGLVAFTGVLITTALAAARGLGADPRSGEATTAAAVLGLVVAVAVHGIVEYVFAFTGHYLVLGLVVGCAASLSVPSGKGLAPRDTGARGPEDGGHAGEQRGERERA